MHCPRPQCPCVHPTAAGWGPKASADLAQGSPPPRCPSLQLRGSSPSRRGGRARGPGGPAAQLAASAAPSGAGEGGAQGAARSAGRGLRGRAGMPASRSFPGRSAPGRTSSRLPTIAHPRPVRPANREPSGQEEDSPKVTPRAAAWGPGPAPRPEAGSRRGGWRRPELSAGRAGGAAANRAPRRVRAPPPPRSRCSSARGPRSPAAGAHVARGEAGGGGAGPGLREAPPRLRARECPRGPASGGAAPQQLPLVKNTPALPPLPLPFGPAPALPPAAAAPPRPAPPFANSSPRAAGRGPGGRGGKSREPER